jgi:hypothetical protein
MDVNARSSFERHVGGGLSLGKSEGCGKSCRIPFEHKFAHLLVDELGNGLFNQGKAVVDFFAVIRGCRGREDGRAILRRPLKRFA